MSTYSNGKASLKPTKSVSGKLMMVVIPIIAVVIVGVIALITINARSIITEQASNRLKEETRANATAIGMEIAELVNYADSVGDALQIADIDSDDDIMAFMENVMANKDDASDAYFAIGSDTFIDGSGWVPEEGYDSTTRAWYQRGITSDTIQIGTPSYDLTTGQMAVVLSRKVTLADGREGVFAVDMLISHISTEVSEYMPLGSGGSMMLDGDMIISYFTSDFNGTSVTEHTDDTFLTQAYELAQTGSEEFAMIKSYTGTTYGVVATKVPDTSWVLISSVSEDDVFSELNKFIYLVVAVAVVVILGIAAIMFALINSIVAKPVKRLTGDIAKIAEGDFRVDIKTGGNDEIGQMNNDMSDFVVNMRNTLGDIQSEVNKLAGEASSSKDASYKLTNEATEQAHGMQQIKDAMSGMADAVTELANNATELATEVSDLTEKGQAANGTVTNLVEKAKNGKEDMEAVQKGMSNISASMTDMNEVVEVVKDSAQKINSIIEMITSIAEQTNLLSLNASIEAARAGEAGKGFAVVATEIGSLATDSADSTTQIAKILEEITQQINSLSEKSQVNMQEIDTNVEAVSKAGNTFAEIFQSLDETSVTVNEMIDKIGKVDTIATSMAAISEEQSASTQEVSATAENLAESAQAVSDSSKGVDESASTVTESANSIEGYVRKFIIN
ncbi:MAG: methyl-accepting chemotaxis protein [Butyrivibrio sp.]|nr:methyl-accepting chemotaxis protein [Butyrivibrio sp.]